MAPRVVRVTSSSLGPSRRGGPFGLHLVPLALVLGRQRNVEVLPQNYDARRRSFSGPFFCVLAICF